MNGDNEPDELPSDEGNLPDGSTWLIALQHFDWLKIPGAVRAIAKLVTGSADAAGAWIDVVKARGEQKARGIRDVTTARSKTTLALTRTVSGKAAADPALLDRAMNVFIVEQLQKQKNREAVGRETANLLSEQGATAEAAEPDEDWLNVFTSFAEKASSERMQKHWASVLAGEIRRPGAFSLSTLQLLAVVDKQLAEIISEVRGWIVLDDFIPLVEGSVRPGDDYTKLMKLDAIGFLTLQMSKTFKVEKEKRGLPWGDKVILLSAAADREISLSTATLTIAGREVLTLVEPAPAVPRMLEAYVKFWRDQGVTVEVIDAK